MPRQARSRERFDAIVEAARELVGRDGVDAVSVREIATRAGVPVASVYQYFPDKGAILRSLMVGYLGRIRTDLVDVFGAVREAEELPAATERAFAAFFELFRREPAMARIWAAVQASPTLGDLDAEDTRENAALLSAVLCALLPAIDPEEVRDMCLFAVHAASFTARLCTSLEEPDGERLLRELSRLTRLRLEELVARQRQRERQGRTGSRGQAQRQAPTRRR